MKQERDDGLDEPLRLEKCAIALCRRLTDGGLYCRRHRDQLAKLDTEPDEQPEPGPEAA